MPVRSPVVGTSTPLHRATCDARWLMAYSAGLGLSAPEYLDTTRPGGVVAHPLFPVAVEWGLITDRGSSIGYGLSNSETMRGVHAAHDLTLHRPLRQGDEVAVTATVIGVEKSRAGARVTLSFECHAVAGGERIWTTRYVTIYRGVDVDGPDVAPTDERVRRSVEPPSQPLERRAVTIAPTAAHVYTECARIWNPIHTDTAVAVAAGLPGPILHGTATLAHGVTATLDMIDAAAGAVRRVSGSFRAMVPMPTTLAVELLEVDDTTQSRAARFQVRTEQGDIAVANGLLEIA